MSTYLRSHYPRHPAAQSAATCEVCGAPADSRGTLLCRRCERETGSCCQVSHDFATDTGAEALCIDCAQPMNCCEPGCTRPYEFYSGRCSQHHPIWAARFERVQP